MLVPEVMIIDDDQGLRLLIGDTLRLAGYGVSTAESGAGALAALRERQPDLVLLDLRLNDMGGAALLDQMREEHIVVPFIVITGQGSETVAVEMMKQGALDYVMKDSGILEMLPVVVKRAFATLTNQRALVAAEAERSRLEKEVLEISEQERRRFGADLHDGVGQQITAIELMCIGLKDDITALDPLLGGRLSAIAALLRDTVAQTRALARSLAPLDDRPEALQDGLLNLSRLATGPRRRCRVEFFAAQPLVGSSVVGQIYRIAQEAINNAVRHSGANEVVVRWEEQPGGWRLVVQDNGQGLATADTRGLGLGIMNYRAGLIGASLTVISVPGAGVTVTCVLPSQP